MNERPSYKAEKMLSGEVSAISGLQRYQSKRVVEAGIILSYNQNEVTVQGAHEAVTFPIDAALRDRIILAGGPGNYLMCYEDGFKSACPRTSFEPNYDKV